MSEPAKVSISPKAMSTEWCISPVGTAMNPHASNAHPKAHIATESINCTFFIINMYFSHGSHGSSRIAMDKISAHPCYPWEFSVGSCGIGLYRSGTTLHHTTPSYAALLLAVLIPLLSEDISPDSRVLLLRGEACLIDRYLLWVDESCTGGAAYIGELIAA